MLPYERISSTLDFTVTKNDERSFFCMEYVFGNFFLNTYRLTEGEVYGVGAEHGLGVDGPGTPVAVYCLLPRDGAAPKHTSQLLKGQSQVHLLLCTASSPGMGQLLDMIQHNY